jgi:RsmE family RNA methyltransferase
MNIFLLEPHELNNKLPVSDRRIKHLIKVIGIGENQQFDAGILNDSIGKAKFTYIDEDFVKIDYQASNLPLDQLTPVQVILGMIRPVNIQRLVRDLCTLGVSHIHFVKTEKSEKSYSSSKAYQPTRLHHYLMEGAEQAFSPFIPKISFYSTLSEALAPHKNIQKFAFDNYLNSIKWGQVKLEKQSVILALGPERGWSNNERDILQEHNFTMCSLGKRVLRSETAAIAAASVCLASLEEM